ncbi:GCN5 family acetyltransferase [Nocardioides sp. Soil797]|nr:GCN5 family acetyltransferase [Nocardioides sp. Soil797]
MTLTPHFAPFGLRITAGPLELVPVTDDVIPELVELALEGIHPPDTMPFQEPWSIAPRRELGFNMAQYYWQQRADFGPGEWSLNFGVRFEGELVGCQDLRATKFRVTRTAESGSWLAMKHQGRGIGTRMRQAICAFGFDELGATELTSGAFVDNPASLAVSRKVGYRTNGTERRKRRTGELAHLQHLAISEQDLVRGEPITVEGAGALRSLLLLDDD